MENGSASRIASAGDQDGNGRLPLSARLLGASARGARSVGRATGLDRTVESVAEEAIVRALESEPVERAVARLVRGPVVEETVQGALESDALKRALMDAMDSELVDELWRRMLASEETQQLVERIAGAPEVRAAISAQGAGLIQDVGRTVGNLARRLDNRFERIARGLFRRPQRTAPSRNAGAVSRAAAMAVDGVIVNLSFTALIALVTLVANTFGASGEGGSGIAIALGSTAWLGLGAIYLAGFWALAGETPGMRFLGIRLEAGRLPLGRGVRRLIGLGLSVATFGLGFLGIVFGEQRRGWPDRLAGTAIVYDERPPAPAPWSKPSVASAGAVTSDA